MATMDLEDALGDLADRIEEGSLERVGRRPPVRDRTKVEELWTDTTEKPERPLRSNTSGESVEPFDGEPSDRCASGLDHRLLQIHRIREASARTSVENNHFWCKPLDHSRWRIVRRDDIASHASTEPLRDKGVFEAGHHLGIVVTPNDVVAGNEPAEKFVEIADAAAHAVLG